MKEHTHENIKSVQYSFDPELSEVLSEGMFTMFQPYLGVERARYKNFE